MHDTPLPADGSAVVLQCIQHQGKIGTVIAEQCGLQDAITLPNGMAQTAIYTLKAFPFTYLEFPAERADKTEHSVASPLGYMLLYLLKEYKADTIASPENLQFGNSINWLGMFLASIYPHCRKNAKKKSDAGPNLRNRKGCHSRYGIQGKK